MDYKQWLKTILIIFLGMLIIGFVVVPLPYYVESPGATIDLKELITVNNKKDESPGSFSLTSVGIRQATGFLAVKAKLEPFEELISEDELTGGATSEEYNQMQQYYMDSSQNAAIEQALKLAGKPYKMEFKGVYVMSVEKNSSFYGKLSVGDTVTKVDNKSFKSTEAFMDYVKSQKVGQTVTITYLHDGKEKEASGKLIQLPTDKKAGIGITLTDHTEIETDTNVRIDSGSIGGPSAGLMFTLEIYEQLTGENLRKGKQIAGTGTINSAGEVGRIGGIDKKVASADKAGVEIFFAPDDTISADIRKEYPDLKTNYEEAKAAAEKLDSSMKIVPVKTVQDALDYLQKMK
ncbi:MULTISPECIES: SepM family pheromone-processing serine protease [unclassified Enterococcus]|uniref:SepM family pheromone-processing serine protease n=1 Tax=unclassified Enterococcus TaxID=2608891 RepID=UPI0013EC2427|nr:MULTISPECIES: SepM family pheromone-processing serine protease [unclassified Enterococcus]